MAIEKHFWGTVQHYLMEYTPDFLLLFLAIFFSKQTNMMKFLWVIYCPGFLYKFVVYVDSTNKATTDSP